MYSNTYSEYNSTVVFEYVFGIQKKSILNMYARIYVIQILFLSVVRNRIHVISTAFRITERVSRETATVAIYFEKHLGIGRDRTGKGDHST
jgi:hypothetical protein